MEFYMCNCHVFIDFDQGGNDFGVCEFEVFSKSKSQAWKIACKQDFCKMIYITIGKQNLVLYIPHINVYNCLL